MAASSNNDTMVDETEMQPPSSRAHEGLGTTTGLPRGNTEADAGADPADTPPGDGPDIFPTVSQVMPKCGKKRGYYALADYMTERENDMTIFRNFRHLNVLALLQLQAELCMLGSRLEEARQKEDNDGRMRRVGVAPSPNAGQPNGIEHQEAMENDDNDSDDHDISFAPNQLSSCFTLVTPGFQSLQWQILKDIRVKLKEYSMGPLISIYLDTDFLKPLSDDSTYVANQWCKDDLLLQFSQVCDLQVPELIEVRVLQDQLLDRAYDLSPEVFMWNNPEEEAYNVTEKPNPQDFVLLQKPDEEKDIVPYAVRYIYHKLTNKRFPTGSLKGGDDTEAQIYFHRYDLIKWANWFVPIVASVLLIASIIILYLIKDTLTRFYVMIPLTAVFALSIKGFTSATRAEIFGAVAGFVAVEVVFVGSVA